MHIRSIIVNALPLATLLSACGGGGGEVASTQTPPPTATPTPTPTPPPAPAPPPTTADTAEYRRSNAAVQAQALTAYDRGATGAGVLVGVIDSGVDAASPEFAGRISSLSADFAGTRALGDEGGHGTAVSSVLLGARNDSGTHGVAFNATLLALRTDTPGSCSDTPSTGSQSGCSHSDNAIAAALDQAVTARARVVNVSLGGSPANSRLRAAIDRATAAGTIIVFSAGNNGETSPTLAADPDLLAQIANDPIARGLIIIAGAVNGEGVSAAFSNKAGNSAATYLTALGERVRSIDETGAALLFTGTSFSAPVIAGAAALLAQAFPSLTPSQIVSLLFRSATDRGAAGIDGIYGQGELNLQRAFQPQGALTVGASATPVSLANNATLGAAMGDAGTAALPVTIRDGYGRDFAADLSPTISRAPLSRTLASALAERGQQFGATAGRATLALAIGGEARGAPDRLLLSHGQAERARVLAGAVALAVDRDTTAGFAIGRSADGLVASDADRSPAFLVGRDGLDRDAAGAFALRRRIGGIGVTLAAESGKLASWQQGMLGASSDGYRRYGYGSVSTALDATAGPLTGSLRLSQLREDATLLGGRFGAALGGGGATSWFADARLTATPGAGWRLGASWRQGWTIVSASDVRAASTLRSRSLAFDVTRFGLLTQGDSLALRYAEPLRVTGGGLMLLDPGRGAAQAWSLTPQGHERDVEAVYATPLGTGWLSANGYWRRQPGHYAAAPDDLGAAVRYTLGF